MSAAQSYFNGFPFSISIPGNYTINMVPKWIDESEPTLMGTVDRSITGVVAVQEIVRHWRPVSLEFKQSNLPGAMLDQKLLSVFLNAQNRGGTHYLRLYGGLPKRVVFDYSVGRPVQYSLMTPTGEEDLLNGAPGAGAPGKLYEATIYLLWLSVPAL